MEFLGLVDVVVEWRLDDGDAVLGGGRWDGVCHDEI